MRHTKTAVPPAPSQLVERAGIRALLDEHGAPDELGRVVLVSAPVGYGKTVAVADWVRSTPAVPTAWVSLDSGDRGHAAWWDCVLGALATCEGVPEDSPLRRVPPPAPDDDGPDVVTAAVLEGLDRLPGPIRLVLDDVHEIVGHPAERGLHALVRYPLPGVTLVLCSRFDAPVGVDRLRLEGRLTELRAQRLMFDVEEATRLFEAAAVDLAPEQVRTLVDRTEGWVAALRLVAMSLRTAPDRAGIVDAFAGDDRSVADYLTDEVLDRLDDEERRALEAASACGPVGVDLATTLTGDARAGDVLARLEATIALVTATDRHRERYRVHELLCSHLLARLRREHPERLRAMYHRAAAWYEAQDDTPAAVHFAALAGDVAGTEALLRDDAFGLLASGRFASLREPGLLVEARGEDARARLALALAALDDGDVEHAAALVAALGPEPTDGTHESTVLSRIVDVRLALARDERARARDLARAILPETVDVAPLRALALVSRGLALAGVDPEQARRDGGQALAATEGHDWPLLVLQAHTVLGLAAVHGHRPSDAGGHAAAALDLAARHGGDRTPWAAAALHVQAVVHLLAGRPDEALADVARAGGRGPAPEVLDTVRRAAEHDAGSATRDGARRPDAATPTDADGRAALAVAALLDQDLALARGRVRDAAEVTHAVAQRLEGATDLAVLRARDAWAAGQDAEARRLLGPVLDRSHPGTVTGLATVQAWVLDTEIALARRQMPLARQRMLAALAAAGEQALLRPLLHASPALHHYLAARRGMFGEHEGHVGRVLSGTRVQPTAGWVALTDREQEVLALLPTTRSAAEIAEDLAVSTNTVKTHQRAIYHKLGAGGRRDAVTLARRAGLLTHTA